MEQNQNLFDDHVDFIYASQGNRFVNLMIDNVFMRLVIDYFTSILVIMLFQQTNPAFLESAKTGDEMNMDLLLLNLIIVSSSTFIYYTFSEFAFKGYTLGKLLTRTKAIRIDGANLTFKDAAFRSLCRMVPFEAFSALGASPIIAWHDKWTNTRVVEAK